MRSPTVVMELPPVDDRRRRLILAVITRSGDRASDLMQDAWLAHLAGLDPLREVWRIDRAARRRAQRERLIGNADLPPSAIRERY